MTSDAPRKNTFPPVLSKGHNTRRRSIDPLSRALTLPISIMSMSFQNPLPVAGWMPEMFERFPGDHDCCWYTSDLTRPNNHVISFDTRLACAKLRDSGVEGSSDALVMWIIGRCVRTNASHVAWYAAVVLAA